MPKRIDLMGQRFERLTVVQKAETTNKCARWICKCDCGNITNVAGQELRRGRVKSCGCLRTDMLKGKSLINKTFGKLKVIEEILTSDKINRIQWLCQCSCGNKVVVKRGNLLSGNTESCGCTKSKGENKIVEILLDNNITFIREYTFRNLLSDKNYPLRFDFAIFVENNLSHLIEYNGEQHYIESNSYYSKEQKERDNKKIEYCKENNINLLVINYLDFNKINLEFLMRMPE